jgi:hypothetical protein
LRSGVNLKRKQTKAERLPDERRHKAENLKASQPQYPSVFWVCCYLLQSYYTKNEGRDQEGVGDESNEIPKGESAIGDEAEELVKLFTDKFRTIEQG